MKKTAVIGAGGTGVALSAILASRGHEVYPADTHRNRQILDDASQKELLRAKGSVTCGGRPALITTDVGEAVRRAEVVVCCTVSNRDEEIARAIAPWLEARHAVLIYYG